ncbi:hypothetical protein EDD21DRAFT_414903 [Dissophora ornata]|nr:hypothetical protein BGZ58_005768 [Dissophora ornata]KAI8601461.1 hypothetical protein EDD21DRAFT_414903 [Dissophora ornata]
MVHHKPEEYLAQHPDLPSCGHFDFFDSAPEFSEIDVRSVWIKDLSKSFWCREAWPIMKGLLSDVDGLTMIDVEKADLESGKRRNMRRTMEAPTPRKQIGRKLDLVARDRTNKRDWFVAKSLREWDEA